ncbi:MAG: DUF922 domain-containing protein [Anaerolineae bacterium]
MPEQEFKGHGPGRAHRPAQDAERSGAGHPGAARRMAVARSLARTLGNRAFSRLAAQGDLSVSHDPSTGVLRRTPGGGGGLTVSLTMSASATQYYQVTGATMEEVDGELPETLGEYRHDSFCNVATRTSEEGETTVTGVTIPVTYYYIMPQWTRLGEQTPPIQAAWRRFYNDLMTHEQEHLSVSRREYNKVRDALRALPADERDEGNIMSVFDTGVDAQNQIHDSHAGFSTPATLVFSDYIPRPQAPQGTAATPGAPEEEE